MINRLFEQYKFNPAQPGMLIIHSADDANGYKLAPLVVVSDGTKYKISQSVFVAGKVAQAQSVTFAMDGTPESATDAFGGPFGDVALAVEIISQRIFSYYLNGRGNLFPWVAR